MLLVAALTLGILIWQEIRRYRERPTPRLDVATIGSAEIEEQRWQLVQVTNPSAFPAVVSMTQWFGLTVRNSGKADETGRIEFAVPPVLAAGGHVTLAVRGDNGDPADLTDAWVRFLFHAQGEPVLSCEWMNVQRDTPLAALNNDQWDELRRQRDAKRRPKFWTRKYWTDTIRFRPAPIAPVEGGRPIVRFTKRRRDRHPDLIAVSVQAPPSD